MRRKKYISITEVVILYILFGALLLFQYTRTFKYDEIFLFIELMMAYIWTAGLLVYAKYRFHLRLFEPMTIISLIYIGIFVAKPITDLRNRKMVEEGVSVIGGGPKATLLFVLGYTLFFFAYYIYRRKVTTGKQTPADSKTEQKGYFDRDKLPLLYVFWLIVFVLCIYGLMTQGLSLKYIFTLGSAGTRVVDENNTGLLFLTNFGTTLAVVWLMILEYSDNWPVKIITTILCIIYLLMRNERYLMMVFLIAPITLYYLKHKKEPKLVWIILGCLGGILLFAWMQANRTPMLTGGAMGGFGPEGLTMNTFLAPLDSDLSTYRAFYAMVERYPSQFDFLSGKTFVYALILFVPRVLWKNKPDNPLRDVIRNSLNKQAQKVGKVYANIGEFYVNFGSIGVLVLMFLFGWITSALKRYVFQDEQDESVTQNASDRQLAYAVLYPLLFQWVARGNFCGNVYITLFALIPFAVKHILHALFQKGR